MDLASALTALGVERSIWIDDNFGPGHSDLFADLFANMEVAGQLIFKGISQVLPDDEFDPEGGRLRGFIERLTTEERAELEAEFLAKQREVMALAARELDRRSIERTSALLKIAPADKISFVDAESLLPPLCQEGDAAFGYIVDLSSRVAGPNGLDTLATLSACGSKGTIFILTHEASTDNESDIEARIRRDFAESNQGAPVPPICVISKARLEEAGEDDDALAEQLKVALKRAGLRRSVHGVLEAARRVLSAAMEAASDRILDIPPEQLDKFMVERAYSEGVSELHVVERALTAKIADGLRTSFMNDPEIVGHVKRVRALQPVVLKPALTSAPHDSLEMFRRMEIWDEGPVLNSAYSPISCGDVFVLDGTEDRSNAFVERRYILLGQQCDVQLRANGKRAQSYAFFVPLVEADDAWVKAGNTSKSKLLPFSLNSKNWRVDYRDATQVRLSVLDLASFRQDGKVAFGRAQIDAKPPEMLSGLLKLYSSATTPIVELLRNPPGAEGELKDIRCQLTFTAERPYKAIHIAKFKQAGRASIRGADVQFEDRITWGLRREGRVRAPYSSSLLRDFLSISGRDAFDLDFAPAPVVNVA